MNLLVVGGLLVGAAVFSGGLNFKNTIGGEPRNSQMTGDGHRGIGQIDFAPEGAISDATGLAPSVPGVKTFWPIAKPDIRVIPQAEQYVRPRTLADYTTAVLTPFDFTRGVVGNAPTSETAWLLTGAGNE